MFSLDTDPLSKRIMSLDLLLLMRLSSSLHLYSDFISGMNHNRSVDISGFLILESLCANDEESVDRDISTPF